MKKLVSMVVALTMAVGLLSGCGSKQAASTASGSSSSKEPVVLHVIHWNDLPQGVIDKFEKENSGIKIQFEKFAVDKFIQVIKTRIAADEVPDILGAQEVDFRNYIKSGVYMDLTNESFMSNFDENAVKELKDFSGDGKVYSIPTNAFSVGLWINKDMFDKNSVNVPTNFDELVQAAEQLKGKGVTPFVQGVKDGWPLQQDMFSMFDVQAKDPNYYEDMKTGKHKWTDSEVKAGFQKWADLFAKKGMLIDGSMGLTYEQAYQTFEQGKVAMWPMGSWGTEFLKDKDGNAKKLPFNVDFISIKSTTASGEKIVPGTYIGAMYSVSAKTKHPQEAKKFIEFLTKPENATIFAKGNGVLFPVKGVDYAKAIPYGDKVAKTTFGDKLVRPFNMTVDASIEQRLTVTLQNILLGSTVDKELGEMQKVQETANKERK